MRTFVLYSTVRFIDHNATSDTLGRTGRLVQALSRRVGHRSDFLVTQITRTAVNPK
jgi:hypothetical protein